MDSMCRRLPHQRLDLDALKPPERTGFIGNRRSPPCEHPEQKIMGLSSGFAPAHQLHSLLGTTQREVRRGRELRSCTKVSCV
jgi:hypothetical protein